MKSIIFTSVLLGMFLLVVPRCTQAEEKEQKPWATVTVSSTFASKYLAFGNGDVLYDKPVIQSDIFIELKSGLYAVLWNSTGFDNEWNNNLADEVDYGIGWNGTIKRFGLHVGVTYFDEPKVFTLGAGDILYTDLRVSYDFKFVESFVRYENYITMPRSGFQGGNLYSAGLSKGLLFCNDKVKLNASVAMVYDDGGFGLDEGFLLRGSAGVSWCVTKKFTVNAPAINYYFPFGVDDRRKNNKVIFAGVSYRF